MSEGPKDFLPGFESYEEFRSALNDAEEAKKISQKDKKEKLGFQSEDFEEDSDTEEESEETE